MNIAYAEKLKEGINQMLTFIPRGFNIKPYEYTFLKVVPYKTGYSGKEFEKVLNTLAKYNQTVFERLEFDKEQKKIIYHPKQPFCYEILFTKEKISYIYAVPTMYKSVFLNKLKFLLDKSDIIEMDDYSKDFEGSIRFNFGMKRHWMFSINTDDKINVTDSLVILNKDLVNEQDKVLIQYLIEPLSDFEWKPRWQNKFNKFCSSGELPNIANIFEMLDNAFEYLLMHTDMILNAIMMAFCGENPLEPKKEGENFSRDLTSCTKHKSTYDGFRTNANLYVKSNTPIVINNVSKNMETIMQDLNGDNAVKISKKKIIKMIEREINGGLSKYINQGNVCSTMECRQLIKTPSESTLKLYEDIIDKINIAELEIPQDLFKGGVVMGELKKGSTYKQMYFGTDADSNSKPLVFVSPQGGGKTTFGINYGYESLLQGDSVFFFDTIDGKTKNTIRDCLLKSFPDDKIIILDYASDEYILPLLWNEVMDIYVSQLKLETNELKKYRLMEEFSGIISSQLKTFIDTIQIDSREQMLTPRMSKILNDITQLVFMNEGTFYMVKDCLYNKDLRHSLLGDLCLPKNLPFCRDIFKIDEECDNSNTLKGIESRLNMLMDNMIMKKLFSINPDKKMNFAEWANGGYCVIINVPENKFNANVNSIVTFLVQKLWLAIISDRYHIPEEKRKQCHLVIDEPNKFPQVMDILRDNIIASRKWRLRFVFLIHNMDIFGKMYENLKTAGTTFIMMPTSRYNFTKAEEFYAPYGYEELKEVEKLNAKYPKMRFALCSIHYKNVNFPCVVKLLAPVNQRYKSYDRAYLDSKCVTEFGVLQQSYYEDLFAEGNRQDSKKGGIDNAKVCI